MINQKDVNIIKEVTEEMLGKMTFPVFGLDLEIVDSGNDQSGRDLVNLYIKVQEPKFLIGQNGQTLVELERILRIVLNKKLEKNFYLKVDINDYQKKKIEHLKTMAKQLADEVSLTKQEKTLPPMSSYERRIVHMELSGRKDVLTQSQDGNMGRSILIVPR